MHRPQFLLHFLALLLVGIAFSACVSKLLPKQGCTDRNSLNYDPDAIENDGSCTYLIDDWVGNYIARDTIRYTDPNTGNPVETSSTNSFSVSEFNYEIVQLSNFFGCQPTAIVSQTTLVLRYPDMECNIGSFICTRTGNVIRYQFVQFNGVSQNISGTAERQL
jgi:hypothetical protein